MKAKRNSYFLAKEASASLTPLDLVRFGVAVGVVALLIATGYVVLAASARFAASPTSANHSLSPSKNQGNMGEIAPFFTPEVRHWSRQIVTWAKKYGLPPNLVATVMQIESCGNPRAVSSAGAMGLFQVMPFHFAAGEDPFDPETNARRGLAYLQGAWARGRGNASLALAGYNGGLGVIGQPPQFWSAETRRYVAWGSAIYRDAAQGKKSSPALQRWYTLSGRNLCAQAREQLKRK